MNGLFGGLFDFNLSNLIGGMDMGVNFNNMNMDQKRQALRGMTKGTMLGGINPELPMPIQLPDAAAQAATGAMDPMMMSAILGGGLLNPQPQQMLPIVQQQAIPGLSIPMADMNRFYGGLL
jgi:hypothetical protein